MVKKRFKWPVALTGGGVLTVVLVAGLASPMTLDGAARILADTSEASIAIATLEARYSTDPRNYVLAGRLADRYMARFGTGADLDDVARAESIVRRLVVESPDKVESHARLSQILLAKHDFAGARDEAKLAIRTDSSKSTGWAVLFDASMAIGNYADASEALSRIESGTLARQLRHARWLSFNGDAEVAYQKLAGACREIRVSRLRPQVAAWCLTELSTMTLERDGVDAAKDILHLALSIQPGYRGALEQLANLAVAERQWSNAAELFERIATTTHPDLFIRLAEVYRELGDHQRATQYEQKFVEATSRAADVHMYAHSLALYLARTPASIERASEIISRDLSHRSPIESYIVSAWVKLQRGAVDAAFESSNKARAIGSPSPTSDYVHGRILAEMGRTEEAVRLMSGVIERPELMDPHWSYELTR